jgi:hypothetical protein
MAARDNSARMAESRFQPGDAVPCSGVYRISHAQHREEHDGILLKAQVFPRCSVCGEQVRFALLQASNPIEQQPDFERD